jgi:CheY-like chemotaxis protein
MTKQATILIIEDDIDLNDAYQLILRSAGHDVRTAHNGEEALATIKTTGDPDIMLLDLRMPVMDGIEFLKQYDTSKHPHVAVVVFSNYDAQKEVDEAYALGAERYVLKARAAPRELLKIVDDILAEKSHHI